ncbi:putative lyase [Methanosarcina horonobensis HB-1 = JCM 15518]|uniref:Putative lyase n=3 Tax=Methanosarcina horonobensis TaxID=418008 RepID=A0A0E3SFG2_9EURY|nr:putative lyase [Methanosarcina horonobensis HB-1 = JCM 15518]
MFFALIIIQLSLFSGIHTAIAISEEPEIEALIKDLNAQDVDVKADSVKVLVEIGEPAVEPLIQALGAEDPEIRENAAITLGKIKDERAIKPLFCLLTDEEWEVEKAATDALIAIGEPAVEPLIEILQNENEDIFLQMKAVQVLAGIKDERAIQPMIQALKENPELDADLGYHLGLMGEPAVEPLIGVLGDNDPKVRARAAEALGRIGDKRAIGPLTETLNDEDERVRLFAKMGLEKIEAQKKNTLIATYGTEREFYIEDQTREWFEQLHTTCELSRNNMELYFYPQGPVISYGCSIENCLTVGILEGSEINNSTLDNIYSIFDQSGNEIGVNDVPVVFSYEVFVQEDEGTITKEAEELEITEESEGAEEANKTEGSAENARIPVSIPGFRAILTLSGVLLSARIRSRS